MEEAFRDLRLEGVFGSPGLFLVHEFLLDTLPDLVSHPTKDPEPLRKGLKELERVRQMIRELPHEVVESEGQDPG